MGEAGPAELLSCLLRELPLPGGEREKRSRSKVHSSPWRQILDPLIRNFKNTLKFTLEGINLLTVNIKRYYQQANHIGHVTKYRLPGHIS